MTRIEELAGRVDEARELRKKAKPEAEALLQASSFGALLVAGTSLDLTVKEIFDNGPMAIDRAIAEIALLLMSGMVVADSRYTLRYAFNGNQHEESVRVQDGTLMADTL